MSSRHQPVPAQSGNRRCTRRAFIQSLLLNLAAGSFGRIRYALADSAAQNCVAPHWLQNIIAERHAAARLGRVYLEAHPGYRHCLSLISEIEQALQRHGVYDSPLMDAEQTASTLRRLIRMEYAQDEVVSVADWLLSETEARLYALSALLP